mmetsp:Transcript_49855/g.114248  ORF Transcript_49855/g.114248 Transcript_49855/m.114248 type:complete len:412 (-) Transcript_49855:13-1248(-)
MAVQSAVPLASIASPTSKASADQSESEPASPDISPAVSTRAASPPAPLAAVSAPSSSQGPFAASAARSARSVSALRATRKDGSLTASASAPKPFRRRSARAPAGEERQMAESAKSALERAPSHASSSAAASDAAAASGAAGGGARRSAKRREGTPSSSSAACTSGSFCAAVPKTHATAPRKCVACAEPSAGESSMGRSCANPPIFAKSRALSMSSTSSSSWRSARRREPVASEAPAGSHSSGSPLASDRSPCSSVAGSPVGGSVASARSSEPRIMPTRSGMSDLKSAPSSFCRLAAAIALAIASPSETRRTCGPCPSPSGSARCAPPSAARIASALAWSAARSWCSSDHCSICESEAGFSAGFSSSSDSTGAAARVVSVSAASARAASTIVAWRELTVEPREEWVMPRSLP